MTKITGVARPLCDPNGNEWRPYTNNNKPTWCIYPPCNKTFENGEAYGPDILCIGRRDMANFPTYRWVCRKCFSLIDWKRVAPLKGVSGGAEQVEVMQHANLVEKVNNFIAMAEFELKNIVSPRRKGILELWNQIKFRFCSLPASTSVDLHHCYACGLVQHDLETSETMHCVNGVIPDYPQSPARHESITIVGFFHDAGKADEYALDANGKDYIRIPKLSWEHHEVHSVELLEQHIKLQPDERDAILYHHRRGHTKDNKPRIENPESSLALLLKMADEISVNQDKKRVIDKKRKADGLGPLHPSDY